MKREDVLIAVLAGTSLVLVVLIVLTTSAHGPLMAQSVDRSNGFLMSTGRFEKDRDALFLIDERSGQMAVFTFDRGKRDVELSDVRDLREDFAIKLKPGNGGDEREYKPR